MRDIFMNLDTNGDGMLSPEEVREGLTRQNMTVPAALEDLLKHIDSDGSGAIDYSEFIAATIDRKTYMKRSVLWSAFQTFDSDGDGKITRDELMQVLSGDSVKTSLGEAKVDKMIR